MSHCPKSLKKTEQSFSIRDKNILSFYPKKIKKTYQKVKVKKLSNGHG